MFPYFGRKVKVAAYYGAPRYPLVIEPFAGSIGYSEYWQPAQVVALEKDERVVALWHRMLALQHVPPPPTVGSATDDLLVKLCSYSEHALTSGTMTVTSRMVRDWRYVHLRAMRLQAWAGQAVLYRLGSFAEAPDTEATWFIDPPYQFANRRGYREGAARMDYDQLAVWVQTRRGQVIVAEQFGATWLPFRPFAAIHSHRGTRSREVIWTNDNRPLPLTVPDHPLVAYYAVEAS
jgi:hypothetical protein